MTDDKLDVYTADGGGLKNNAHDVSDEVRALIGQVTKRILSAGYTVTPEKLIQALFRLSANAGDAETRLSCLELIQRLMKKMH
ncbi:hypothetical protein ORN12_18770 [Pantoea vagans]|uniref:hypothetical protein n=1 Tax=Pantoea vagans TaxID=470934 RepID=UPI0022594F92|nr:hypothetical protein [Pantoea vagans]MCX3311005.1 hypothetical protein [Pantoea vagans]